MAGGGPHAPAQAEAGADWQVVHVHPGAPAKPAVGAPCNGCGVCCLAEPCPLGVLISRRRHGACDALRWDPELSLYRCGALGAPESVLGPRWRWASPWLARAARRWIAAGIGCDSTLQPAAAASTERATSEKPAPRSPPVT